MKYNQGSVVRVKCSDLKIFGVVPDIVVMGKALGGGLPIGAFSASKKLMQKLEDDPKLGHITTFGGNPVIATAAHTTIVELMAGNGLRVLLKEKIIPVTTQTSPNQNH